ncbi:class II 3-deoxy-7-phosphoheptulonate synthase [Kitasatospora sp. NPDC015120]|uniref:class II 3-deoxy-7-phosphoheptulonate synthase n=1 Tax=Kitasatospora sp. NPDC015120 TaxID=3364023 RepID=UPI0036F466D8
MTATELSPQLDPVLDPDLGPSADPAPGPGRPRGLGTGPAPRAAAGTPPWDSWRDLPAAQQPAWPDRPALRAVTADLAGYPALVAAGECDRLRARLAAAARGEAFLLQGGDCAETFDGISEQRIHSKLQVILQMAAILAYAVSVPVVTVGRLAGQYAKPRSRPTETRGGLSLPVYRGDAVNAAAFTPAARTPDPERLKRLYHASAATLNVIRSWVSDGGADLRDAHERNRDFVGLSPAGEHYRQLVDATDEALRFLSACGVDSGLLRTTEFFTSHEALLLDYESALVRPDPRTGARYDTSAHMLWIGERTRQPGGAHIAFAAGIRNPIGVKLGPATTADEALELIDLLDPEREPGRLTFITRMGADRITDVLPDLVRRVTDSGAQVVWVCDPMHGNTFEAPSGHKTRSLATILAEVKGFFEVHRALGTHPGGLHLELTGDHVTECLGGADEVLPHDLYDRYETACDPRLNRSQSLDLAFLVAEIHRSGGSGEGTAPARHRW